MWSCAARDVISELPVTEAAFVFGVLGVVLTIRQSIYCWPAALISTLAATFDFFRTSLYGDMALQVFYFFAGIYGWIYWNKKNKEIFDVKHIEVKWISRLVIATALQTILYYYLLVYFKGTRPFLDALLTAASLTTTFMMTKKWIENWLIWVFIDSTYIVLYALTSLWLYAVLYFLFALIAFYGWRQWKKKAFIK